MSLGDMRYYADSGWGRLAWCIYATCTVIAVFIAALLGAILVGKVQAGTASTVIIAAFGTLVWLFGRAVFYIATGR